MPATDVKPDNCMSPRARALDYLRRGWTPIPVVARGKRPLNACWQDLRLEERQLVCFGAGSNIGIVLGDASGGLVDVDLDHPRAVELASQYLPPTEAVFGRPGKPRSHYLYRVTAPI